MATLVSVGSITITDVNDGSSVYTASIYLQQDTLPTIPTGGSYNFSTKTLVPPTSWIASLPTASTVPTWVVTYTFSTITSNISVLADSWSVPTMFTRTGTNGTNGLTAILTNESHVFPAINAGSVTSYTGSGTDIHVYEGGTELVYDGVGTANGTWKVSTSSTNITIGTLTDMGAYLTIGAHSGVSSAVDLSDITYTITGKNSAGVSFTLVKLQTFTKAKTGNTGSAGSSITLTSDRVAAFKATDGALDSGQNDIVLTANLLNITNPTYTWSFDGF